MGFFANPMYYEKMSILLDELIKKRKREAMDYEKYLEEIVELTRKIKKPEQSTTYPMSINTQARRALYDNLASDAALAAELDETILYTKKDDWRNNRFKKREVRLAIEEILKANGFVSPDEVDRIMGIVEYQQEY